MEFQKFNKIPRLSRDCIITEKIDGTNAQIFIYNKNEDVSLLTLDFDNLVTDNFIHEYSLYNENGLYIFAGSRKRWLTEKKDNYGFAKWVQANAEELLKLGEGRHYGEWYGKGIQRKYGLEEKRFALFNVGRWHKNEKRLVSIDPETKEEKYTEQCPDCCEVVPVLYEGLFGTIQVNRYIEYLSYYGSKIVPGFRFPEGIIIFHSASGKLFKKSLENDEKPKGQKDA